jgi:hypothetical protein
LIPGEEQAILGKQLNLIELLPCGLKDVSIAISMGNFEGVANAPEEEVARARDDLKNSVAIGLFLYDANRWIYGDGAFGLRLLAWIARKPLPLDNFAKNRGDNYYPRKNNSAFR